MINFIRINLIIFLFIAFINGAAIKLQNSDKYSGCEDGYLSAMYATTALIEMSSDTLTNHFVEEEIYLSR